MYVLFVSPSAQGNHPNSRVKDNLPLTHDEFAQSSTTFQTTLLCPNLDSKRKANLILCLQTWPSPSPTYSLDLPSEHPATTKRGDIGRKQFLLFVPPQVYHVWWNLVKCFDERKLPNNGVQRHGDVFWLVAASSFSFSFSFGGGSATVGAGSGAVGTSAPSCRKTARGDVAALPS